MRYAFFSRKLNIKEKLEETKGFHSKDHKVVPLVHVCISDKNPHSNNLKVFCILLREVLNLL